MIFLAFEALFFKAASALSFDDLLNSTPQILPTQLLPPLYNDFYDENGSDNPTTHTLVDQSITEEQTTGGRLFQP